MRGHRLAAMVLAIAPALAVAYPEGAPWGAADPDAPENCATCHFDYDARLDSTQVGIGGLPDTPSPGQTYEFVIRFSDPDAAVAGFQLLARSGDGDAGRFASDESAIEIGESGIRSTDPSINDNGVVWRLSWTAPELPGATIRFFLAVTGSNDDGSPFGDQIHFRSFSIEL